MTATPSPTPTRGPSTCTATFRAVSTWPGGYQGEVTVTAGPSALSSWTVSATGLSVSSAWNGIATTSGTTTTVRNAPYNGTLTASGSTTFGFIGNGSPGTPLLSCTP